MDALRLKELKNMTESEAARIFAQLDVPHPYPLRPSSGLVEQQYWFKLLRVKQATAAEAASERNSASSH